MQTKNLMLLITFCINMLFTTIVYAESAKPIITISNFTTNNIGKKYAGQVRSRIEAKLYALNKFRILERDKIDIIDRKHSLSQSTKKHNKLLHPDYIITGSIDKINGLTIHIKVIDATSGYVLFFDTQNAESVNSINTATEIISQRVVNNLLQRIDSDYTLTDTSIQNSRPQILDAKIGIYAAYNYLNLQNYKQYDAFHGFSLGLLPNVNEYFTFDIGFTYFIPSQKENSASETYETSVVNGNAGFRIGIPYLIVYPYFALNTKLLIFKQQISVPTFQANERQYDIIAEATFGLLYSFNDHFEIFFQYKIDMFFYTLYDSGYLRGIDSTDEINDFTGNTIQIGVIYKI